MVLWQIYQSTVAAEEDNRYSSWVPGKRDVFLTTQGPKSSSGTSQPVQSSCWSWPRAFHISILPYLGMLEPCLLTGRFLVTENFSPPLHVSFCICLGHLQLPSSQLYFPWREGSILHRLCWTGYFKQPCKHLHTLEKIPLQSSLEIKAQDTDHSEYLCGWLEIFLLSHSGHFSTCNYGEPVKVNTTKILPLLVSGIWHNSHTS